MARSNTLATISSRTLVDVIADYSSFSKLSIKLVLHGYETFLRLELIYFLLSTNPTNSLFSHSLLVSIVCYLLLLLPDRRRCFNLRGCSHPTNIPHHQINLLLVIITASLIHTTCHKNGAPPDSKKKWTTKKLRKKE